MEASGNLPRTLWTIGPGVVHGCTTAVTDRTSLAENRANVCSPDDGLLTFAYLRRPLLHLGLIKRGRTLRK